MTLKTALLSCAALAVCQLAYGQGVPPQPPVVHAAPGAVRAVPNFAAPAAPGPTAMPGGPQMNYGMASMPADGMAMGPACSTGTCATGASYGSGPPYAPWWHRTFVWSYWKMNGLPSPWVSTGDLSLHIPYCNTGSTYYYFRPYNSFHISDHQNEASNYNGDPRNPYDNRVVFDGLYDGL